MDAKQQILDLHADWLSPQTIARRLSLSVNYVKRMVANVTRTGAAEMRLCLRCSHKWPKRSNVPPNQCPKCKNRSWSVPRKRVGNYRKPDYEYTSISKAPDPTFDEIATQTAAIRKTWSNSERLRRAGIQEPHWHPPTVSSESVGFDVGDFTGSAIDQERC